MSSPGYDIISSSDFDREEFESLFGEGELDVDKQIEQLRKCIEDRNRKILLEKIAIGTYLSGNAAALEIRDDMVGLPPALAEFVIGHFIVANNVDDQNPSYGSYKAKTPPEGRDSLLEER
ncbi:hypothetical protein [Halorubrum trueperi]|uniref:Uncharacterized protein n=1 Tax=Halorubrum trueperi TaxID=2004704 RepID=A0ABD5UGD9_9EURY